MHKVIYARSLKGQTVLVEVIAKMYPCNYTLGEETLPLSQYSSQARKLEREDCQGVGCNPFSVIPRMTEEKIKFLI